MQIKVIVRTEEEELKIMQQVAEMAVAQFIQIQEKQGITNISEEHYTYQQVIAITGISKTTLIKYNKSGKLPRSHSVGKRIFYKKEVVDKYISGKEI